MKPKYCAAAACFSYVVYSFLGFLLLLLLSTSTSFVESVSSPTQPSAAIYSLYNTAVPVNVSARPLSSTAAVVSWTLTKSITVIANNNNNGTSSGSSSYSINEGAGEEAVAASDQQQQQSTSVAVNSSIAIGAGNAAISSPIPIRLEITYKPIQDRQKMVVAVPPQISSYILSDLKPGSVYTVSVTSIGKGHRSKSAPVQLVMMPRQLPSPPPPSAHLNSPPTSTRRPPPPPPPPPHPSHPGASNGRTIINYTDYYSNNLFPKGQHGIAATSGTAAAAAAAAGVVYVRPEEIGIVILVLLVWVAAVGLFFHRWGKIRMLLPYQPVFKEEEPVIVAACSPSPTLQRMMSSSSQDQQQQMGMGCSQQSSPSPAVLVSANKFVSLDPAAIRRNQFKLHSRLARMQAYGDRRPWPSTSRGGLLDYSVSGSMGSRTMIRTQGAATPAAARRAFAANTRRANTIAIEDPANPSCCPACRCPQQSQQQQSPLLSHQGHNSHLQQQQHHHHIAYNSGGAGIHHPATQTNIIKSGRFQQQPMHNRRDYLHRLHHFHPAVQMQSSGSSEDQFPVPFDQQQQPRKAVSAEVITLTVTECCETAENTSSSSSNTSPVGSDKSVKQTAAALQASFAAASTASTATTISTTSTTSSSSSPTVISVDDATIIHVQDATPITESAEVEAAIKTSPEKVVDIVNTRTPIESTL